jgi:LacI family transcriptional regulator
MVKKITSFDVARRAGVSQPTVSRTLRNLPGASPATRQRVLAAAEELAYIPSDSGRALSTRSTRRIAVVSEDLTNPFYPELVQPLGRFLAASDLRPVLITDSDRRGVDVDVLADGSYDGIILTTTTRRSTLPRDLTERGVPHVLMNRVLDHPESPSCGVDNGDGARRISELLAGLGHRRVASVQGPVDTSTGKQRAEALRTGLRRHGIPLPRALVRRVPFDHDAGCAATVQLLGQDAPPTAIVCGNDVLAIGALSAARSAGLRVPQDVSIIGFDDIRLASWPLIDLTTVHCDLEALARTAVDMLQSQIAGRTEASLTVRLPVSLVLRGTHGVAPN